ARTLEARSLAAERAEAARSAVDRRIHETVLNTLATISRARIASGAAQAQCAEDLRALDSAEGAPSRNVQKLLARLLQRHPVPGPTVSVIDSGITFGDDDAAQVAYAALGEVMRNVVRHSQATRTLLQVRAPEGRVVFTVSDDGVGMDETTRLRFGMRRAIAESVESLGGSVAIDSRPGAGTTVTIVLPRSSPRAAAPALRTAALDVLLGPLSVRAAMASALLLGVVFLLPTAAVIDQPILIVVTYALFALAVVVIAARWTSPGLTGIAWLSLALMAACQVVAWSSLRGCASSGGLHQVLFTTAGAMILSPLALRRPAASFLMVALVVAPTLAIPWALPAECRAEAVVPAAETALWVIALVSIIVALSRAFDRSSATIAGMWAEIADTDARLLAMQAADQRWRSVDASTRALLSAVADGTASPADPDVRDSATRLEARLRSLLETSKIRSSQLRACLEGVVEDVTAAGVATAVSVVSDEAEGPVAPRLQDDLVAIGLKSARSGLHITVLDGELLVSADRSALDGDSLGALGETDDPATAVAVLRWESVPAPI
ncbi:MAG: sensor histidine kinase, partial [bacterium]